MPIATPDVYNEMLDRAKERGFAYPAINCTSSETLNAAIRGYAEAGSDGIVQVSTGGAAFLSGQRLKDMVTGAVALAEFATWSRPSTVNIALHTDHCPKDKLDGYMRPLIKLSQERVAAGQEPLFQSHMWDGSAVPLDENLQIADELLAEYAKARIVMEMEIGVVGGEEDDVVGEMSDKLYSTPRTPCAPPRPSARASAAATCWPPPSATSTASTSRATSSSAPSSSRSCSGPWATRSARTAPSTSSSTVGRGRCWPRSARPSATAWSR